MSKRRLSFFSLVFLLCAGKAAALPLNHYVVTKITDPDITVVTVGKTYTFLIQGEDVNGGTPTSGNQDSVVVNCGGISPCNFTVTSPAAQPPGSGRYTPNPLSQLTVDILFTSAPDSILVTASDFNTPTITGDLAITVQLYPTHFDISVPPLVNAGSPFTVTITALDQNNATVTSFRDGVNLTDKMLGTLLFSMPGSSFSLGQATATVTLIAGDPVHQIDNVVATNSVIYVGQGSAATATSPNIDVQPGAYATIVLVFPGEVLTPGVVPGKNSSGILTQVANTDVQPVAIYATDQYYNPITSGIPSSPQLAISFTSNIGTDVIPGPTNLISNPLQFVGGSFVFPTVGQRVITAQPNVNPGNTSESTMTVVAGAIAYYLFTAQPAPGSVLAADTPFSVTITAYDGSNNVVTTLNGNVIGGLAANISAGESGTQWVDTDPATPQPDNVVTFSHGVAVVNQVLITIVEPSASLTFTDGNGLSVTSNSWQIEAGSPAQMILTFPGESFTPGTYPGNSGTPTTVVAGSTISVEASLTDRSWNVISGVSNAQVNFTGETAFYYITSTTTAVGGNTIPISGQFLGSDEFKIVFRTAGSQYLNSSVGGGGLSFTTPSPQINIVPAAYSGLAIAAPGETLRPGIPPSQSLTGKLGTVTDENAGVPFPVTVYAVDAYFNPISASLYPTVNFNFEDPNGTVSPSTPTVMSASSEVFMISLRSLVLPQVTVYDSIDSSKSSQTVSIPIIPGALDHFTIAPIGTPQEAGISFGITVTAEDKFNNTILQNYTADLSVNTGTGTFLPSQINLVNGVFASTMTVFAATPTAQVTVSIAGTPSATANSNFFVVDPASLGYSKLLMLLPGETAAPGTATGKIGSATPKTVGLVSIIEAISCDAYYNPVNPSGPVTVAFSSNKYAQFGSATGSLVNVNGVGEYSTTLILRTAGTHTLVLQDVNNDATITRSTDTMIGNAGAYSQIQILAPGQVADPGTFVANGTTGVLPSTQAVSQPFNVTINAVDNFWNVVPYNGGDIDLNANVPSLVSIPPNNPSGGTSFNPFVNGVSTREVIIGESGLIDVTATDNANLVIPGQTVDITVTPGPVYVFQTPASAVAGQPFSPVTITLQQNGVPLAGYDQAIFLTAAFPSGGPASGAFNSDGSPREYVMNNGSVTITDLTYAYVENIQIKLTDNFSRVAFSSDINVTPSGLKYQVTVGTAAVAGPPSTFPVQVELLEENTNTLVKNHDHTVNVAVSAVGSVTTGLFPVASATFSQGVANFQESYTKAEPVIIKISESSTAGDPSFPAIPSVNSNDLVIGPDGYKKLLLLAPGEVQVPGVPSATGKLTADPPFTQQKGIPFLLQVRGVDEYWNVDATFNGGEVQFASNDSPASIGSSNPNNQNAALVNGESASSVVLNNSGEVNVTVEDASNAAIGTQSDLITVGANTLQVTVPAQTFAGPPTTFTMNVTLLDFNTGLPIIQANYPIQIFAFHNDGTPATGTLGVSSATLSEGTVGILTQSYSIPEDIYLLVTDSNGDTGQSGTIHIVPREVRYTISMPAQAVVHAPWTVTVNAIDEDTGSQVKNLNRTLGLEAFSVLTSSPATGAFSPTTLNLSSGVAVVSATYDTAERIYLQVTDNTSPQSASPPTQPSFFSAGSINITPGPMASVSLVDFTMQSNSSHTVTALVLDGYGNPIPQQTVLLTASGVTPPAAMSMNNQVNKLSINTDVNGQFIVTFAPTLYTDGVVDVTVADGDIPNGFSKVIAVTVQGFPLIQQPELAIGQDRVAVGAPLFINLNGLNPAGGTVETFYRFNNGPWVAYNPATGILSNDPNRGFPVLNEATDWNFQWYSQICYTTPCTDPVSELPGLSSPHTIEYTAYNVNDGQVNCYPSPFNPKGAADQNFMTIQYPLSADSSVSIDIYDLFGRKVWHKDIPQGSEGGIGKQNNRVFWLGTNDEGVTVGNGGYIVRIQPASGSEMKAKFLVVK